ncbi:AMP-binding protein [Solimonas terrae]|uniref:Long-chain fatty acid--CoA ligase n=1 Tax=Solimonas terrae TaxID=1396819 RepID=A0A6M2BXB3_9GAMM|nr:AMP-binding protein [Solimonas terrae]NGY06783.1 long-chain fatty acid--CoA ligase [Solimonas terrae]
MQFTQGLHRAVQQKPDEIATICGERQHRFSDLRDRVARIAGLLSQLGVRRGDVIAIQALNSDRYIEFFLASSWLGAVANPVNFRWSAAEVIYSLKDSAAVALFVDDQFASQGAAIKAQTPSLRELLFIGDGECPTGMRDVEAALPGVAPIDDAEVGGDELFGVFYTGGTTGAPKGVMLSHLNICSSALSLMAEGSFPEGVIGLHAAPMFHLGDMMLIAGVLLRGGRHVAMPMFRPELALQAIARHRITDLLLVPTMLQALVDCPAIRDADVGSVRRVMYGAAPVSEALLDRAMLALPGVEFTQVYGMTEMSAVMTVLPPSMHLPENRGSGRVRSAGRAAYHMQVRVVDADDRELSRGEVGEITFRGPNLMKGYLNKQDASAAALRNGWMHSGDMGYMDDGGYLFIVDRLKDMIICGGENVYSAEVENAIGSHPAVLSCAVFGVPHAEWGELVHAAVILKPGAELALDSLQAHCRALIAGYKLPRGLEIHETFPTSGAGKILKTELRKPHWQGRERAVN